jgi:hypothetical protein
LRYGQREGAGNTDQELLQQRVIIGTATCRRS